MEGGKNKGGAILVNMTQYTIILGYFSIPRVGYT